MAFPLDETSTRRGLLARLFGLVTGAVAFLRRDVAGSVPREPSSGPARGAPGQTMQGGADTASSGDAALDEEDLLEVAGVVLPDELGDDGRRRAVERFLRWLRDYEPGETLAHGYGHTRVATTPPSPASGYAEDLAALDERARSTHGSPFGELDTDRQRQLLSTILDEVAPETESLPSRPGPAAPHVALGLMAHFFGSSEANDLCYRREIDRESCRDLYTAVEEPPPPLDEHGGGEDTRPS